MSVIRVDNFGPSAGGTTYSARGIAKAWVNFDGTGTIAARDSENVSSLTDNGTGDYTVSISNAFGAADYTFTFGCRSDPVTGANFLGMPNANAPTTSSVRITNFAFNGSVPDTPTANIVFHGDLA
jgi:hypothetical protein